MSPYKHICTVTVGIFLVLLCAFLAAQAQSVQTPPWLTWLGNGSANWNCSGKCVINDEVWFASFTLPAGSLLLNTAGNGPIIIRATGTCTIAGTINTSPNYPGQTGITGHGDFGGGGGGGGGGASAGIAGMTTEVITGIPLISGGPGGAAGGGAGHNGISVDANQWQMFISNGSDWPGGGAPGGYGANTGGIGGQGGAPVIIACGTIDFTGTINVTGGNGANSPGNNQGGGGGGGGGYVLLAAQNFTAQTGTFLTSGGTGGTCGSYTNCGIGGNGGNGWAKYVTIQP